MSEAMGVDFISTVKLEADNKFTRSVRRAMVSTTNGATFTYNAVTGAINVLPPASFLQACKNNVTNAQSNYATVVTDINPSDANNYNIPNAL